MNNSIRIVHCFNQIKKQEHEMSHISLKYFAKYVMANYI